MSAVHIAAAEGFVSGLRTDGIADGTQHRVDVLKNVVVPEAQDPKATLVQIRIPTAICITFGVLAAVHLKDQPVFETRKIGNRRADWNLAPEFQPVEAAVAQAIPEAGLRVGWRAAHAASKTPRPIANSLTHAPSPGLPTSLQSQAGAPDLSHKGRGDASS